ncbi:MAG: acylphosphatase, partial [Pyrobaculum sp.]
VRRVAVVARGELVLPGVPILKILASEARRVGVSGVAYIRDGVLYAVFEGPDEAVEQIVHFIPVASPAVKIRELEVREEEYRGEFSGFVTS